MSSKYEDLEKLRDLYSKGILTETEFNTEKEKILSGISENETRTQKRSENAVDNRSYSALLHLSQFSNYLFPFLGVILPVVMWATRKNESKYVDVHGKIVLNWIISSFIYVCVFAIILIVAIIGIAGSLAFTPGYYEGIIEENPLAALQIFGAAGIAVLPLIAIAILDFIFTIIGAVKASNGEVWNYPLSIRFFSTSQSTPKSEI